MSTSTQLAQTLITTENGLLTATELDRVSPDRVFLMLVRGSVAAKYAGATDVSPVIDREIKELLVNPRPE